ncbi:MAG TPA: hypothetical protein VIQ30_25085 [Pseudonocardia sp.]|jgi:hypothetical protein
MVIEGDVSASGASIADLAQALFCSGLRPDPQPTPDQVRDAVRTSLAAHDNDTSLCACELAQAYGDYPEIASTRMRWCCEAVAWAFNLGVSA